MTAPPHTSPNVDNYFIGKGNVYLADDLVTPSWRHVGNVPKFEFIPKLDKKKHYSSMEGTKVLDRTAFIAKEAEVHLIFEELTPENLVVALLGDAQTDTTGTYYELLGLPEVLRAVKLTGTNDFGAKVEIILHKVFFAADKAVPFIGEDWMGFELTGDVLETGGSFGTLRFLGT